jgi:hypothetical protein
VYPLNKTVATHGHYTSTVKVSAISARLPNSEEQKTFTGWRGRERIACSGGPHDFNSLKNCYNSPTKKTKLNSDYTIKFVSINTSKQDITWIYLDKVTN